MDPTPPVARRHCHFSLKCSRPSTPPPHRPESPTTAAWRGTLSQNGTRGAAGRRGPRDAKSRLEELADRVLSDVVVRVLAVGPADSLVRAEVVTDERSLDAAFAQGATDFPTRRNRLTRGRAVRIRLAIEAAAAAPRVVAGVTLTRVTDDRYRRIDLRQARGSPPQSSASNVHPSEDSQSSEARAPAIPMPRPIALESYKARRSPDGLDSRFLNDFVSVLACAP